LPFVIGASGELNPIADTFLCKLILLLAKLIIDIVCFHYLRRNNVNQAHSFFGISGSRIKYVQNTEAAFCRIGTHKNIGFSLEL